MTFTDELSELVAETVSRLPGISKKRMFGCDAFFRSGQIFALIWKTGRIGVRLSDVLIHDALMASPGAEPWQVYDKPSAKPMKHWVLVPEAFHDDTLELASWLGQAYTLAAPTQSMTMTHKSTAKKSTAKQPAAKKSTAKTSTAKQPAAKKSAAKQPTAKKSTAKQPAAKKSAAKQPAAKQPAAKKLTAKKPEPKK